MLRNHGKPMKKIHSNYYLLIWERTEWTFTGTHNESVQRDPCVEGKKLPRVSMFSGDRNLKGNTFFNLGKNITAYVWYPSRISALILRV